MKSCSTHRLISCRPPLALQRLRGPHASRSAPVSASALTRVPCFAVGP
ncbi:hypothetical protein BSLA_01r5096 [Burkholderia stabilis]|nr:hypothetical protein BSLA_01r5096 [Burkholderia stabilis]